MNKDVTILFFIMESQLKKFEFYNISFPIFSKEIEGIKQGAFSHWMKNADILR